jgi:hypothetical protein
MSINPAIIASNRERVNQAYNSAIATNNNMYLKGDEKATEHYIFPNQKEDANDIVREFKENNRRVVSVAKKTKVGMDGLMIEVAKLMTTHTDDAFVVNFENVRIITGMSNAGWEKEMKDKSPECFKDKIFHHGQLRKADLNNLQNALIIIDEIDTGDKEFQVLHSALKEANVLNVQHMEEHNNRFMFGSATMIKELYALYQWGELHAVKQMTIPSSYIGHIDFLNMGIIKEFYPINTSENAEKWVQEDIIDNYGQDYRVHLARVTNKSVNIVQNACIRKGVLFRNHTSTERLSQEEIKELFKEPLKQHIVVGVKGFFRRANLIPDAWKMRIGATHEHYTKKVDNNVQIQGLPGRMSGFWRSKIENGHKTGPHRTSIRAVEEYEKAFHDPFGLNSYQTSGFTKKKGKVFSENTMVSPKNIEGLVPVSLPAVPSEVIDRSTYRIYLDEKSVIEVCKILGYRYVAAATNENGFRETSLNNTKQVATLEHAIRRVPDAIKHGGQTNSLFRTCYPCYENISDKETLRFVVIIRPTTDAVKIKDADERYPSITYTP